VKTALQIGLGIVLAVTLVVVGLGAGWVVWGRRVWAEGPVCGTATGPAASGRSGGLFGMGRLGRGMMGSGPVGASVVLRLRQRQRPAAQQSGAARRRAVWLRRERC